MLIAGKSNEFELKLSIDPTEIRAAQRLRYKVFYEEMGALQIAGQEDRLDRDEFDAIADHLIVIDRLRSTCDQPVVVGYYRALRAEVASKIGGLYTQREFDLKRLLTKERRIMELGRSCVDCDYRSGLVLHLLWRGIAALIESYDIQLIVGCASFHGTVIDQHAPALAYLHSNHLAPKPLRPRALGDSFEPLLRGVFDSEALEAGRRVLPPLVKGYLRAGAKVGDGVVVDHQFNTVDVCMVLATAELRDRYQKRYHAPEAAQANRSLS